MQLIEDHLETQYDVVGCSGFDAEVTALCTLSDETVAAGMLVVTR